MNAAVDPAVDPVDQPVDQPAGLVVGLVLDGTIRMQPGQERHWMVGRRVRIVRRIDPRAGVPAVWCTDLTHHASPDLGVLVADVQWRQPADVRIWLAEHPPPRRR